ncbi:unnamed protein product [Ectocarpus sp. 4 AP-2014]
MTSKAGFFLVCTTTLATHFAGAWQHTPCGSTTPGAKMLPSATSTVPGRSCRTALQAAASAGGAKSLTETMADSLAEALGVGTAGAEQRFKIGGGGYGGGGGASVGTIDDLETGDKKYFYKKAGPSGASMLEAERAGLQAMYEAKAIRVPRPICGGDGPGGCFAIFEHLNMGGRASAERAELMGAQLAQMHRSLSPNGKYGFHVDNTIGATAQPNGWMDSWADFWVERRLLHMIRLSEREGGVFQNVDKVVEKTRSILAKHEVQPCLVHGDLWGGNQGFVAPESDPVIFDPATYYGDREVDLGMTHVFGGFPPAFYRGYEKEWPLPEGHQERQVVYNVYHILNHHVLFGGGYLGQAQRMMGQILNM